MTTLTIQGFIQELITRQIRLSDVPQPQGESVADYITEFADQRNAENLPELVAHLLHELGNCRSAACDVLNEMTDCGRSCGVDYARIEVLRHAIDPTRRHALNGAKTGRFTDALNESNKPKSAEKAESLEEAQKRLGFESHEEWSRMVAAVDLTDSSKFRAFISWRDHDGTKDGLLKLPVQEKQS